MRYRDFIGGFFWLAIGIGAVIWSMSYEVGSLVQPGPGFLPLGLGLLLILLSLVLLAGTLKSFRKAKVPSSAYFTSEGWRKVGYAVIILAVAAFFFEKVGYLLSFFFLIFLLMVGGGRQSWRRILLVSFFSALGVYLVFVRLLGQPLPRGFLGV